MRAGVALGSNLGDRLANLKAARERIVRLPGVGEPMLASSVYETEPVKCEAGAGKFLNAVIELQYDGDAAAQLRELRQIEATLGRPAEHARNISRTLDLDLLYFGDMTISQPELELPHPRMHERRFVLEPLAEIRPDLVLPGQTQNVAMLLAQLPDRSPLLRVASEW
jgi:2-amino-4-hydroxy-6-hydroxymethyldihydropteridine diphosphokinase